jgi:hypothetical protein
MNLIDNLGFNLLGYYIVSPYTKDEIKKYITTRDGEINDYKSYQIKLQNNYNILNENNTKLQQNYTLLTDRNIKLQNDYDLLNKTYTKLKIDYETADNKTNIIKQENTKLQSEYEIVSNKLNIIKQENTKLQSDYKTLNDKLNLVQNSYNNLVIINDELKTDIIYTNFIKNSGEVSIIKSENSDCILFQIISRLYYTKDGGKNWLLILDLDSDNDMDINMNKEMRYDIHYMNKKYTSKNIFNEILFSQNGNDIIVLTKDNTNNNKIYLFDSTINKMIERKRVRNDLVNIHKISYTKDFKHIFLLGKYKWETGSSNEYLLYKSIDKCKTFNEITPDIFKNEKNEIDIKLNDNFLLIKINKTEPEQYLMNIENNILNDNKKKFLLNE